jgi:Ca2+-binding RTX toxin-like protein
MANSLLNKGKGEQQMRRGTLMFAAMALMVALFAAVAYAATIQGTNDNDILLESQLNDTIFGRTRGDAIFADIFGPASGDPADRDVAKGNKGPDFIRVDDGDGRDTANGGLGNDTCFSDPNDTLISCETENPETTVAEPVQ